MQGSTCVITFDLKQYIYNFLQILIRQGQLDKVVLIVITFI